MKRAWTWIGIAGLGTGLAVGVWLVVVQFMLTVWDPLGTWQAPGLSKATITQISRDTQGRFTGQVLALEGERPQEFAFSKAECAELEVDEELWVLHNYRTHGNRPGEFRLTPLRLLLEYPEPWMALALWGILRLRRRLAKEALPPAGSEPKVWRDDFHQRAQRFSVPKEPGE